MSHSCGQLVQVRTRAKQGAPWQFNNLQCHLGAIALPVGTVIVIISEQNIFSVLITPNRLSSSFPGTLSSFLNVLLFCIRATVSSLAEGIIFWLLSPSLSPLSLSPLLLETEDCLTICEHSALAKDLTLVYTVYQLCKWVSSFVFFSLILSLTYLFRLRTHYEAAMFMKSKDKKIKAEKKSGHPLITEQSIQMRKNTFSIFNLTYYFPKMWRLIFKWCSKGKSLWQKIY